YTINNNGSKNRDWIKKNGNQNWHCYSLKDAFDKYFWNGDFYQTSLNLNKLNEGIRKSYSSGDDNGFRDASLEILKWGGVSHKNNKDWLKNNNLVSRVNDSIMSMNSFPTDSFNKKDWDGKKFRMNAGYTKIYSLL